MAAVQIALRTKQAGLERFTLEAVTVGAIKRMVAPRLTAIDDAVQITMPNGQTIKGWITNVAHGPFASQGMLVWDDDDSRERAARIRQANKAMNA